LGSLNLLASRAHAKDKHEGSKGFVLNEISGSARGKKKGNDTEQNNGGGRLITQAKVMSTVRAM
jgi:hypothetical protein